MVTVKVDFSAVVAGGMLRTSQRRADSHLSVGDHVLAFDPAEGYGYPARVARTTPEGRVYLDADWDAPATLQPTAAAVSIIDSSFGASASGHFSATELHIRPGQREFDLLYG